MLHSSTDVFCVHPEGMVCCIPDRSIQCAYTCCISKHSSASHAWCIHYMMHPVVFTWWCIQEWLHSWCIQRCTTWMQQSMNARQWMQLNTLVCSLDWMQQTIECTVNAARCWMHQNVNATQCNMLRMHMYTECIQHIRTYSAWVTFTYIPVLVYPRAFNKYFV